MSAPDLADSVTIMVDGKSLEVKREIFVELIYSYRNPSLDRVAEATRAFQAERFPMIDTQSAVAHLLKEVIEVYLELWNPPKHVNVLFRRILEHGIPGAKRLKHVNRFRVAEELADCDHLIEQACTCNGHSRPEEWLRKLGINAKRSWGEPDEHGIVEHVEEGADEEGR